MVVANLRRLIECVVREPLTHFLGIGLLLFVLFRVVNGDRPVGGREIVVTQAVKAGLAQQFAGVRQRPPTADELSGLVEGWVREEVFYREGLALGLDQDDPVIRRRIGQKLAVVAEESQSDPGATDEALAAWLRTHGARYARPAALSFEQAVIDPARHRGDMPTRADEVKRRLERGAAAADVSESRLLPTRFDTVPEDSVARDFGEEFALTLRDLPLGSWQGPLRSGYGWHLVRISTRKPGRAPTLDEVRDQVVRDFEFDRRARAAEAYFAEARSKYQVRMEAGATEGVSAR